MEGITKMSRILLTQYLCRVPPNKDTYWGVMDTVIDRSSLRTQL